MIQLRQLRVPALMALLALGSLRCSDKTEPPQPSTIEKMDGDQQTAPVGTLLPTSLAVLVLDDQGDPVQGVSVSWSTQSGGSLSSPTSTTGSNGRATIQWVLGSALGQQTATATVSGLQGSPVTFTATATDSDAPKLVVDQQPSAAAQSGVTFAIQPIIQLQDANGSDLAQQGVEVTASLASGSGTLGGDVTQSTDATGKATFTDLAITGTGSFTLAFSAAATTPGVSSAIVLGAAPAGISITTNPPVSALTSEVFDPTVQPVVHVTDQAGNAVAGTQVTASIATGSGTLEGNATATTDANGVAAFGDLGISGTGEHTILFTSGPATVTSSPVTLSPLSNKAAVGEWGPVVDWAIVPLHMGLLPNGKIFAWGKTESPADTIGMPRIWDPAAGPPSSAQKIVVPDMLFCAGLTLIPDGRLMLAGGHHMDAAGIKATYFFDQNGSFVKGDDMHHGRWYPTLTVLGDGRILSMAGRDETKTVVRTPEIFEGDTWVELPGAGSLEIPYYPRNFVDPKNGLVFYASERVQSRWFNVDGSSGSGRGSWTAGPTHLYGFNRDYGSAVMYDAGKILVVGGGGNPQWGDTPDPKAAVPTATAEKIDLNQPSPSWQSTGSMGVARRHMNATVLPDGRVLATGGTRGGGFVNLDVGLATKQAEVWDPGTGQWTTLAAAAKMRVYHSVSLLLPDGRVLHGASGDALAGDGVTVVPSETNHEIFSPPYMFKGARPTITSAPATVTYDQTFSVATPNAAQITAARWIRLGAVTHAFDVGGIANTLTFTRTVTGVDIKAPSGPNIAPPGYYMVFVLNRNGVPSAGKIVKVQ